VSGDVAPWHVVKEMCERWPWFGPQCYSRGKTGGGQRRWSLRRPVRRKIVVGGKGIVRDVEGTGGGLTITILFLGLCLGRLWLWCWVDIFGYEVGDRLVDIV